MVAKNKTSAAGRSNIKPAKTELQQRALKAFDEAVTAFRKNASASNWSTLELCMLAHQQSSSRFKSGLALAERALIESDKPWLDRRSAQELMDAEDPENYNSMNQAALREA